MKNKELVSYAILSVNYDSKKEYLSNFEPFILEIIKEESPEHVAVTDIQKGLLNQFGLTMPSNVIKTMCSSLADKNYFFKKRLVENVDTYSYVPNYEKINEIELKKKSTLMSQNFDKLVLKYQEFIKEDLDIDTDEDEAILHIEVFIKENNLNIVSKAFDRDEKENKSSNYLVGKFVNHININDQESYNIFLDIVKGNMLSEALYYNEPGNFKKKFNGSKFYFDTSFLMYALGYSGSQRKKPCIELIELLKKNGADLYCFDHNINEAIGILTWSKHNLNSGKDSHNTIEYFRENSIDQQGIDLIISNLEYTIESQLGLKISEKIEYDHQDYSNVIDYSGMMQYLQEKIYYNKDESLNNDVESIASIMRLRKRKQPTNIEDCGAVFVTTNGKLCRTVKEYFTLEGKIGLPPILTDNVVTNLVWLKNPDLYPELPSLRLIADCFAATNPNDRLWNKYIDKIEKLVAQGGIIDKDSIITLRYLPDAKKVLMDKTLGDENAISDGTAKEVLIEINRKNAEAIELAKEKERKKAEIELQKEKEKNKNLSENLKSNAERNKTTLLEVRKSAEKQISAIMYFLVFVTSIIFGVVCFISLGHTKVSNEIQFVSAIIVAVVIPVLGFILSFFDFDLFNKIKEWKVCIIEKSFKRKCIKLNLNTDNS